MSRAMQQYQRAWTTLEQTAAAVAPSAWERPSPCPGWTARQLVGHLVDGHHQVQALLAGTGPAPPTSDVPALAALAGPDPASALRGATTEVRATLARLDPAVMAETPRGPLPVEQLLSMAVVEPFVHGWDLAVATGQHVTLDPELTATLLPGVQQLGGQLAATGMYAPARYVPDDAPDAQRLLAALGRPVG